MYAVIDTETTGFRPGDDRMLELAIVGLDAYGRVEWEWCTLLNPGRPTHNRATSIHGIYDRDLEAAQAFSAYAGYVSQLLNGRVIVGHNVTFDLKFLLAEYELIGANASESVTHLCTMAAARQLGYRPYKLAAVCAECGVPFTGAHHALADARATAALASNLFDLADPDVAAAVSERAAGIQPWPPVRVIAHEALTRPILPGPSESLSQRTQVSHVDRGEMTVQELSAAVSVQSSAREEYLVVVDAVLEDRVVTADEEDVLVECAIRNGLTREDLEDLHLAYVQELAGGMWADEAIDAHEMADLKSVAKLLLVSDERLAWAIRNPTNAGLARAASLEAGQRVVFTGQMSIGRADWKARAEAAGLRVTGSVSGKTDWLVVPSTDPGTQKGRDAAAKGVRVVTEQQFIRMISALEVSASGRITESP